MGNAKAAPKPTFGDIGRELKLHVAILASIVAILWAEEIADTFLGGRLDAFGIRPREIDGLSGILFSPFLHGGFDHLLGNTIVFLGLGWFVLLRETWHFFAVSIVVALLGGLGVWCFGQTGSVHVGASGVIFGYLGYLMLGGWFERRIATIFGSIVVAVLYGSLLWGVLPSHPGISWEGHLFGFLAGVLCAWMFARREKKKAT
jgi:membrane associated rhomboid family serine protease